MMRFSSTSIKSWAVLFGLFLFLTLPADRIVLHSGQVINDMEILDETEEYLRIRTRYTEMSISRNRIQSYEKNPESRRKFYLDNARHYVENEIWDSAREEIRKALALQPDCKEGFELLKIIEQKYAEKQLERYTDILNEARKYKRSRLWEEALPLYEKILENVTVLEDPTLYRQINREISTVHFETGKMLIENKSHVTGEMEKAVTYLKRASEYQEDNADLFFLLGIAHELLDKPQDALHHYLAAIDIDSHHIRAHENLTRLRLYFEDDPIEEAKDSPEPEDKPQEEEIIPEVAPLENRVIPLQSTPENDRNLLDYIVRDNWQDYFTVLYLKDLLVVFKPYFRDYWKTVVYFILFIIFFWVIPNKHFERNALNKTFFLKYKKWVKILGILTYLFFIKESLGRLIFTGVKKGECSYCRTDYTDFYAWKSFDFAHCPHCGHELEKPFFKPRDYLYELAHDMAEKHDIFHHGQKGVNTLIEKENITFLIQAVLSIAIDFRSTDLHFEPSADSLRIRNRVDGLLYDLVHIPMPLHPAVISALKIMATLDISEKRRPQDGKFKFAHKGNSFDVRVSTAPTQYGEKVNLRLLPRHQSISTYEELGLEKSDIEKMHTAVSKNFGLILSTGPTGSGKTTTLYTILQQLNTGDKNIITLEDPIEYEFKGISQMQVNQAAGFTFANGLRSILRQDPDIIMVGEIRDNETAEIGVNAALTGHIVLSTLHTIDAVSTITRLIDMNVESTLFARALNIIIAQRLIRVNCLYCSEPYQPDPKLLQKLNLEKAVSNITFKKGKGCKECNNIGYFGRTGIFEILVIDDKMKELMEQEAGRHKIMEHAKALGMKTLKEKSISKIIHGITTVEEIIRVIGT